MRAQCQCGQLAAQVPGPTDQLVVCHCIACQRRSGSPYGTIAYYPAEDVTLTGKATEYSRTADSGNKVTTGFCPDCGSTMWFVGELKPGTIGIPLGLFADPGYPPPARSVYEATMHHWVTIPGDIPHFPRGRT